MSAAVTLVIVLVVVLLLLLGLSLALTLTGRCRSGSLLRDQKHSTELAPFVPALRGSVNVPLRSGTGSWTGYAVVGRETNDTTYRIFNAADQSFSTLSVSGVSNAIGACGLAVNSASSTNLLVQSDFTRSRVMSITGGIDAPTALTLITDDGPAVGDCLCVIGEHWWLALQSTELVLRYVPDASLTYTQSWSQGSIRYLLNNTTYPTIGSSHRYRGLAVRNHKMAMTMIQTSNNTVDRIFWNTMRPLDCTKASSSQINVPDLGDITISNGDYIVLGVLNNGDANVLKPVETTVTAVGDTTLDVAADLSSYSSVTSVMTGFADPNAAGSSFYTANQSALSSSIVGNGNGNIGGMAMTESHMFFIEPAATRTLYTIALADGTTTSTVTVNGTFAPTIASFESNDGVAAFTRDTWEGAALGYWVEEVDESPTGSAANPSSVYYATTRSLGFRTVQASSSGDPEVHAMDGTFYVLPVNEKVYRAFQTRSGDLVMNVKMDMKGSSDRSYHGTLMAFKDGKKVLQWTFEGDHGAPKIEHENKSHVRVTERSGHYAATFNTDTVGRVTVASGDSRSLHFFVEKKTLNLIDGYAVRRDEARHEVPHLSFTSLV